MTMIMISSLFYNMFYCFESHDLLPANAKHQFNYFNVYILLINYTLFHCTGFNCVCVCDENTYLECLEKENYRIYDILRSKM